MASQSSCYLEGTRTRDYCPASYGGSRFSPCSQRESMQKLAEKQDELELRALTAEMEASHLRLELANMQDHVSEYKMSTAVLNGRLEQLNSTNAAAEEKLERFYKKLSRIRAALTKEVDKMKKKERDLHLACDSTMRCILEFRSNVISKATFLSAVDLIDSTVLKNSSSSMIAELPLFTDTETEKLALLSPNTRKSRLQSLMSMLSEQVMCASTDDDLLDDDGKEQTGEEHQRPPPRRVTVAATPNGLANIREAAGLANIREAAGSGSGSDITSPPMMESSVEARATPDITEDSTTAALPLRSQTVTLPHSKSSRLVMEKSGFLKKMDFRLKNWNRRWFVLKGTELKYYKPNRRALKGVINLDSWCKLVKGQSPECFQLVTPKKTYHLVCKSDEECNEWLQAVGSAMHLHKMESSHDPLMPKVSSIAGWAHMNHKGQSKKVWCALNGPNLDIYEDPQSEPHRRISIAQSSVRKRRDSILLDSSGSHSNLRSMLFTLRDSTGVTEIFPEIQEDKDSWYYHLSVIQCGEQNLQLTKTEKFLTEIMTGTESNPIDHPHWKHPVLNCISGPLLSPLTSLPSTSLNVAAKKLFQSVCHFLNTKLTPFDLTFHIHTAQYIITTCLKHCPLQDELYCQVLRQISGHTNCLSTPVMQGWLLLSIIITSFLPIKPKFTWYLKTYFNRHSIFTHVTISRYARYCQEAVSSAQDQGLRQCKPSNIELVYILGNFAERCCLDHTLIVPVYLTDSSTPDLEFTPFTTIRDLTASINEKLGMPEASQTGFAIMCDWPGMDDATCCCPIQESKVVDVLSTWSAALDELNGQTHLDHDTLRIMKSQRNILFTYKRRLFIQSHDGSETDREAMLLAYQISRSIHSGEYPVVSMDKAATMAAMMTQIEYGDWNGVENERSFDELTHEVIMQFCPWSLTHMALAHDLNLLQRKLVENWKALEGTRRDQCARSYVSIVQQWSHYGSTFFQAEECASNLDPRRLVCLAVSEQGVSILEKVSMKVITSYKYNDISTFGGNGENHFMLVITSQGSPTTGQRSNQQQQQQGNDVVEKLIFKMPKLKICEATFLIASYIEVLTS